MSLKTIIITAVISTALAAALIISKLESPPSKVELPVSKVQLGQVGAATLDMAAREAIRAAIKASSDEEYAGGIYRSGNRYYFTIPISQHSDSGVDYAMQVPAGAVLVAVYHTHPSSPGSSPDEFSSGDIETAKRLGLIMFVGVIHSSTVMEFNPQTDHPAYNPIEQETHYAGNTFPLNY